MDGQPDCGGGEIAHPPEEPEATCEAASKRYSTGPNRYCARWTVTGMGGARRLSARRSTGGSKANTRAAASSNLAATTETTCSSVRAMDDRISCARERILPGKCSKLAVTQNGRDST